MSERDQLLEQIERRLGHRFRRRELLERAFTHRSYANERELEESYERLEFLGDAVLGLATAEKLYAEMPGRGEGALTRKKAHLVSARVLAGVGRRLGLGAALRLGVGEERSGGRHKGSLLADAVEAVLGAVFLDGGYPAARRVAVRLLEEAHRDGQIEERDAKTRLQELAQGRGWDLPAYRELGASGPDHERTFTVECRLGARAVGVGEGRTKKGAETRAAAAVLAALEDETAQA